MEFDPDIGRYSGRRIMATVTDVRRGGAFGIPEGYVMLSLCKEFSLETPEMPAFLDMICACGERFGWSGEVRDAPPCPRCGAKVEPSALASDLAEIERFRALLRALARMRGATGPERDAACAELERLIDEAAQLEGA